MKIIDEKKKWVKKIKRSKCVFIMAHKDLDLDALGSSLGMYEILTKLRKTCYLVIDDKKMEDGVKKVYNLISNKFNIIKSSEINNKKNSKEDKNLLLILDTNKKYLLQNESVLDLFSNILIFDHHQLADNSINNAVLIVDNNASSTCEMIASLIEYYGVSIDSLLATILLSGIVLDTNNFMIKTNTKTYYTAYFLTTLGADPKQVQYLLKQDLKKYVERQKVITDVVIINNNIALSMGGKNQVYRREDLAKIADTLLLFSNIEASFVIGNLSKKEVGISARSMGNISINEVLTSFGGGGDRHDGAAKIIGKTILEVEQDLKKVLRKIKKGE